MFKFQIGYLSEKIITINNIIVFSSGENRIENGIIYLKGDLKVYEYHTEPDILKMWLQDERMKKLKKLYKNN